MSTASKRRLDPSNLVLPAGAPAVDSEARRKFVEGEGAAPAAASARAGQGKPAKKGAKAAAPAPAPASSKTKKADRQLRQLLVYMSTPELRRDIDIRTAEEGVSLSAWVERLAIAELAKPAKRPAT
jgi:hypothetical protein